MKTTIIAAFLVGLVACAIGWLQSHQLQNLESYAGVLRKENLRLEQDTQVSKSSHAGTAGSPVQLTDHPDANARAILDYLSSPDLDADLKQDEWVAFIGQLATLSTPTVRALLEQLPSADLKSEMSNGFEETLLIALGKTDSAGAADIALQRRSGALKRILAQWVKRDLQSVHAWGATLPNRNLDSETLANAEKAMTKALGAGLMMRSSKEVIEFAADLPQADRPRLLSAAAAEIDDHSTWLSFAREISGISDDRFRWEAVTALIEQSEKNGSLGDLRSVVEQLPFAEDEQNGFIVLATTQIIDSQTAERANWMLEHSHPDYIHENIGLLIEKWSKNHFNGVANWLPTVTESPVRETAVWSFAHSIAAFEPQSALEWAQTLRDPAHKAKTVSEIIAIWQANDPDSAAAYLEQSPAGEAP